MKKIYVLLLLSLIFTGCQKEELIEEPTETENSGVQKGIVSKQDILGNLELMNAVNTAKMKISTRGKNMKSATSASIYAPHIDLENAIYLQKGSYHSYTFPVVRRNGLIENLVVGFQENGSYRTILVTYSLNGADIRALKNYENIDLSKKTSVTLLDGSYSQKKSRNKSAEGCFNVEYFPEECDAGGKHTYEQIQAGERCYDETPPMEYTYEISFSADNCDADNTGSDGTGTGETGTGETGTGETGETGSGETGTYNPPSGGGIQPAKTDPDPEPDGDLTSPILPSDEFLLERFFTSLPDDQKSWIFEGNNLSWFNNEIVRFLRENNLSLESKLFAKEAITAKINGGEVDFDEMYIETATPDDNFIYLGEKEFIPNILVLDNGGEVGVVFGVTASDGESANKEVAKHLIDGLKYALNEANNNLSSSDKITEIYIMATTNGAHGPYSNHTNGTAIDISRINGEKMILSGVTNPIIELQEAFDDYEYIRENFGPFFKHKYSIESDTWNYNHPVGGHKDHIHISTRKP